MSYGFEACQRNVVESFEYLQGVAPLTQRHAPSKGVNWLPRDKVLSLHGAA